MRGCCEMGCPLTFTSTHPLKIWLTGRVGIFAQRPIRKLPHARGFWRVQKRRQAAGGVLKQGGRFRL